MTPRCCRQDVWPTRLTSRLFAGRMRTMTCKHNGHSWRYIPDMPLPMRILPFLIHSGICCRPDHLPESPPFRPTVKACMQTIIGAVTLELSDVTDDGLSSARTPSHYVPSHLHRRERVPRLGNLAILSLLRAIPHARPEPYRAPALTHLHIAPCVLLCVPIQSARCVQSVRQMR